MKLLRAVKLSKSGASAAEYALIIGLIGGVITVGAALLGQNMQGVFNTFAAKVVTGTDK